MATQIFYQYNFFHGEKKVDEILSDIVENYTLTTEENISSYRQKIDAKFLHSLVYGLSFELKKIDEKISLFLQPGYSIDNLDSLTLQILRCGIFELEFMKDIPPKAVINEYVDIAACFLDNKKITFVNAVLDACNKTCSHISGG